MVMIYNFTIEQGCDFARGFLFRDCEGNVDLTGYTAAMQIRQGKRAREAVDTLTTENGRLILDKKKAKIDMVLPHDVTATYPATKLVYDLIIKSADGFVYRMLQGTISVNGGVTRV